MAKGATMLQSVIYLDIRQFHEEQQYMYQCLFLGTFFLYRSDNRKYIQFKEKEIFLHYNTSS